MSDAAALLAEFAALDTARVRRAAADRRALIADALHAAGRTDAEIAAAVDPQVTRQAVQKLRATAPAVYADSARLAAALALGGPIPTSQPDRRAS